MIKLHEGKGFTNIKLAILAKGYDSVKHEAEHLHKIRRFRYTKTKLHTKDEDSVTHISETILPGEEQLPIILAFVRGVDKLTCKWGFLCVLKGYICHLF